MTAGRAVALPALHDTGAGPAVLFLHAFPLDASQWDHQVAAISGRYRCLRADMWGCGSSPAPQGEPNLRRFAGDVLEALDERRIERFVGCGGSMGGYVIWELLRLAPQRITALVLCSTRAVADSDAARQAREQTAQRVLDAGVEVIVEENVQRLLGTRSQGDPHIADPVRARIRRCTPEGIANALRAMAARPDSTALLPTVDVPTLVVAGVEDAVISSKDQRAMSDRIRGAEFVELDRCGHLVNLERPGEFSNILERFLASPMPR
jgi:pimeloyl-ACP methyl ester carboxylesterase